MLPGVLAVSAAYVLARRANVSEKVDAFYRILPEKAWDVFKKT